MSGFTGRVTAAPTPIVDDVGPCFTVAVRPVGPLLSDPLTSSDGWTTFSGSPTFADGVFSGGAVYRDLGAAMGSIKFALAQTIAAGSAVSVIFCINASLNQYYRVTVNETRWALYKGLTQLMQWATGGQADDAVEITIDPDTGLDVLINGVSRIDDDDTEYAAQTYFWLQASGATGAITVDPDESVVLVMPQ